MANKQYSPEQAVAKLRQIDVLVDEGKSIHQACKEAGITDVTYYRWRKEYGGLKGDQARRLKELERENQRLKRVVADLSLEKAILKAMGSGLAIMHFHSVEPIRLTHCTLNNQRGRADFFLPCRQSINATGGIPYRQANAERETIGDRNPTAVSSSVRLFSGDWQNV